MPCAPTIRRDNTPHRSQILKRRALGTLADPDSAVKRAKKKARRSLGRRVSFAPDAELETTHLYEKV
jgi:hypothetical protein